MRALILSDIHANLDALDAVLAAAPAHDTVWNLGDSVGYGAQPNEVIERVRGLGRVFVRGNHDRACCGLTSLESFNAIAARAAEWTSHQLTEEHTLWLRALPHGPVIATEGVACMHGSAADEDEYLLSIRDAIEDVALAPLHESQTRVNFFGHTHVQGGFATNGEEWFRLTPVFGKSPPVFDKAMTSDRHSYEEYELQLRAGARYLLNPGSVGQPRDQDWRAACALYDSARATVTFLRIPYDVRAAQTRILEAGLPDRLAARLRTGR
jgi:diadenosine tetraphosphatase ApaH/serine/threonine PP2A family protein phosphatase